MEGSLFPGSGACYGTTCAGYGIDVEDRCRQAHGGGAGSTQRFEDQEHALADDDAGQRAEQLVQAAPGDDLDRLVVAAQLH